MAEFPLVFPNPVDIVYIWVNGNDESWQSIKKMHEDLYESKECKAFDAASSNRFKDNDELKYSLRSVWKNAPFVNHIYIVTMDQAPEWLLPHPKISIIDHKEIFSNPDFLPTFNSHAIESNLHRIPDLHDHFLYFNDDVFLGRRVTPFDFFTENGELFVLFEASLSPSGPPAGNETSYRLAWRNTNALLDHLYGKEERFRLCHAPFALIRSYIEETEGQLPDVFLSNSSHKFRSSKDYNLTNGLLQYDWVYKGKVLKSNLKNKMVTLRDDDRFIRTANAIAALKKQKPHTFCLQDNMKDNCEKTKQLAKEFLEKLFPEPAPWEKN
jgi:hypothetical protein